MYNAVFKIIWLINFNPNNLPTSTFYLLIMLIIIPIWVPHTVYQKSKLLSVFLEDLLLRQKSCCSKMLCQTLREYQKSNFYQIVDLQHILCFFVAYHLIGNQNICIENLVITHYICIFAVRVTALIIFLCSIFASQIISLPFQTSLWEDIK